MTAEDLGALTAIVLIGFLSAYYGTTRLYTKPWLGALILAIGAALSFQTQAGTFFYLVGLFIGLVKGWRASKAKQKGQPH